MELNVRVYVVEKGVQPAARDKPPIKGDTIQWVSVHTTEDAQEAVRVAKEEAAHWPSVRVRQFWISRTIPQRDMLSHKTDIVIPEAGMEDMTCIEHPEVKLRWRMVLGGVTPTCSICHKPLVTQALIDQMANPVDLSET